MIENIKRISNPLTIVAIFAALAEIASTTALAILDKDSQKIFIWFMMGFPTLLVCLFFYVLYKNPRALYAPSDYRSDESFLKGFDKDSALRVEKHQPHPISPSSKDTSQLLEQFKNLAHSIGAKDTKTFSGRDRDTIMLLLDALSNRSNELISTEFPQYLEEVVDAFASAGLNGNIDSIDDLYRQIITHSSGITQTFIQHYGMRVLNTNSPTPTTIARFTDYVNIARKNNLYEIALPFYLTYLHTLNDKNTILSELELAKQFPPSGIMTFKEIINRFSDTGLIASRTTPEIALVARKFQSFRTDYSKQIEELNISNNHIN